MLRRYLARRLLVAIPSLLIASLVVFALPRLIPGDVVAMMLEEKAYARDLAEMRAKLDNAQILLAAMVTRDFRTIGTAAERLSRISEMEIASWQAQPVPPQYTQQVVEFLTAVRDLRQASQARDMVQSASGSNWSLLEEKSPAAAG